MSKKPTKADLEAKLVKIKHDLSLALAHCGGFQEREIRHPELTAMDEKGLLKSYNALWKKHILSLTPKPLADRLKAVAAGEDF